MMRALSFSSDPPSRLYYRRDTWWPFDYHLIAVSRVLKYDVSKVKAAADSTHESAFGIAYIVPAGSNGKRFAVIFPDMKIQIITTRLADIGEISLLKTKE